MDYQFWLPLIALFFMVTFCERKWCMLRDLTKPKPQPYSWSRVQLAWWTVIILSAFISILWKSGVAPTLSTSALILLGISSLTTVAARSVEASADAESTVASVGSTDGFFLDILSDQNGVSISRFQAVIFNFTFGVWFVSYVMGHLSNIHVGVDPKDINAVMPTIDNNNLVLLGLSSATYAAMKITEKKEQKTAEEAKPEVAPSEEELTAAIEPAVG